MALVKAQADAGGNAVRIQSPGDTVMEQLQVTPLTTVGAGQWTAQGIVAGIIERTGPTGAYNDTLPTGDQMLAAIPGLSPGDSFNLWVRNTVAFAATLVANTGFELSGANTGIAASSSRLYTITCLSNLPGQLYAATTTNGSAVISGLTQQQVQNLMPGMGVTGTGIPASTTVIGVNPSAGTVTLSANATVSGTLVGLSFFPRFTIKGIASTTL